MTIPVQPAAASCDGSLPSLGQLRWRTRRGLRELDLILQRYLQSRYPQADTDEQRAFALLLEQADPDILDWIMGRAVPPAGLKNVVGALAAAR
ncbi:MAG: succinate dehydrogenase assembly factor 2 [Gammaproteobacteria bacterium]